MTAATVGARLGEDKGEGEEEEEEGEREGGRERGREREKHFRRERERASKQPEKLTRFRVGIFTLNFDKVRELPNILGHFCQNKVSH